jgi:hypothetical protein
MGHNLKVTKLPQFSLMFSLVTLTGPLRNDPIAGQWV